MRPSFQAQCIDLMSAIVFRREPIWKVTMSVRLRSTVRCTYDETQGALRVTLKEPIEGTQQEHLVIYALKVRNHSGISFIAFVHASARTEREGVAIGVRRVREDCRR